MRNLFVKHPRENANESWWKHFKFTASIGVRLFFTGIYFVVHGLFPFIEIKRKYNLRDTSDWLWNKNINREVKRHKYKYPDDNWVNKVRK